MKTPVIIPAYNEAERIGLTLHTLDPDTVEPIVVVNGEEGSIETTEAALCYTSNVFVRPEQGKLPAIQYAFRKLRQYDTDAYKNPILLMDADSQPLRSKEWAPTMSQAVMGETACSAAGIIFYRDGAPFDCLVRNARRLVHTHQDKGTNSLRSAYGANMAVNFAGDDELIEKVQALPHIWPSEDRYLFHLFAGEGERDNFTQLATLGSAVLTSARYMSPITQVLKRSREERTATAIEHYRARKAHGATHYFDEPTATLYEYDREAS